MSARELRWQPYDDAGMTWERVPFGRVARGARASVTFGVGDEAVVAVGAFDGMHVGHRSLVGDAIAEAARRDAPCVVATFDPDPSELVGDGRGDGTRLLPVADRVAALLSLGADAVVVLSFDEALAGTGPQRFVSEVLGSFVRPLCIHVGSNFRFGRGGTGDVALLVRLGMRWGFEVREHELVACGGSRVSSTRVRALLGEGRLDEANALLGRCHYVRGLVEHGRGEGTSFGFPTANVRCATRDRLPAYGVYACYVTCGSRAWPAAANVGAPATFLDEDAGLIEANLLGFEGDLYGSEVSVSFVRWLREERTFESLEELERVVLGNIAWVRENLGSGELDARA